MTYADSIFPTDAVVTMTNTITNIIKENLPTILGVLAMIVGITIIYNLMLAWLRNDKKNYLIEHNWSDNFNRAIGDYGFTRDEAHIYADTGGDLEIYDSGKDEKGYWYQKTKDSKRHYSK